MQITVFFIAYTKKLTTLSHWVLIICSMRYESGLQITLRLLSSSLGNTVLLHTVHYFSNTKQIGEKNTGQCFSIELQFTCIASDKSEKNRKTA